MGGGDADRDETINNIAREWLNGDAGTTGAWSLGLRMPASL